MNRIECPACGSWLPFADDHVGRWAKCRNCNHVFRLPNKPAVAQGSLVQFEQIVDPASDPGPLSMRIIEDESPRSSRRFRSRVWVGLGGLSCVLAVGLLLAMLWIRPSDEPYAGPPPPVEFEFLGLRAAPSVPFHGSLAIREGVIVAPAGPEGYAFTTEHPQVILGRSHRFGWKPTSGMLLLVACKLTVKTPAPQLERLRLLRGEEEVAILDGVAQPGFDQATAEDLNEGLAECHAAGKTPEPCLVFRVPDEAAAAPEGLVLEVEWRDPSGGPQVGRYSLSRVPPLLGEPEEPGEPEPAEDDAPATLAGEGIGQASTEPHVRSVLIEKDEFPCEGEVRFFHQGDSTFEDPNASCGFDGNHVRAEGGDKVEVGAPVIWSKEGDEIVGTHAKGGQAVARLKLSGRSLSGAATMPEGVRLFMGNATSIDVGALEKRGP